MSKTRPSIHAITALGLCASAGLAQSDIEWASPVDGDFGVAANWLPAVVPGATDTAVLGGTGPYTVRAESVAVGSLVLANPAASLRVLPGASLTLAGSMSGSGEVVVGDGLSSDNASVLLQDTAVIRGVVRLNGLASTDAVIRNPGGLSVVGDEGRVVGQGRLGGAWISTGVMGPGPGDTLSLGGCTVVGGGVRNLVDGRINLGWATLDGVLIETNGGEFDLRDTLLVGSTIRGSLVVKTGNNVDLGAGVTIEDEIVVGDARPVSNAFLYLLEGVVQDGVVRLHGFTSADATVRAVAGSGGSGTPGRMGAQGVLAGQGTIIGLRTEGVIAPASPTGPIGHIRPQNRLTLDPTAKIEIDVASAHADGFDRVDGATTIIVDGTLAVRFLDGFRPEPGDRFECIRGSVILGAFARVQLPDVPAVGPAHVVYTDQSVLVVVCAADRDGDGELTIFDFLVFQNQFDAGDLRADLDGDGALTIFDFLVFQNRFDAGCA